MIVNMTPHDVTILDAETGDVVGSYPPSGTSVRSTVRRAACGFIRDFNGSSIPIYDTIFGPLENAPKPQDNTYFIVSRIVADAAQRTDFIVPDCIVRDDSGKIVGCTAFARASVVDNNSST